MKIFPEIDERLATFIRAQQMFFVATAPIAGGGWVNLSPKGPDGLDEYKALHNTQNLDGLPSQLR